MTEPNKIPKELKLPAKFYRYRKGQEEAVERIVNSDKRLFLLDAPTGSGKSLSAIASARHFQIPDEVMDRLTGEEHKYRCIYVTRTKQLQDQVRDEFGAIKVMGRRNYSCVMNEKLTADDCPGKCEKTCPYLWAKSLARNAPLAALNDAYWLTEANHGGMFSGANLVVLDEIDSLESSLENLIKFTVSEKQCKQFGIKPPKDMESIPSWLLWAETNQRQVQAILSKNRISIGNTPEKWTDTDWQIHKEIKKSDAWVNKMTQFINEVDNTWIVDVSTTQQGWLVTFKPVIVAPYCEHYLWRHGKRFLGMSGTILEPKILAEGLGLDEEEIEYMRLGTEFKSVNRLIRYRPVANLRYRQMQTELPKALKEVSDLIRVHEGLNILVHTTSYSIRDFLLKSLPGAGVPADKLVTHNESNRAEQLELFKHSTNKVMLSPSFDRGVSLAEDECRCVIIVKTPYLNTQDKQVAARLKMTNGQRWYNLRAIQTVVQMCGRAVRSNRDWSHTYILDKQFQGLLARTQHLLPKWWLDSIVREERNERATERNHNL